MSLDLERGNNSVREDNVQDEHNMDDKSARQAAQSMLAIS